MTTRTKPAESAAEGEARLGKELHAAKGRVATVRAAAEQHGNKVGALTAQLMGRRMEHPDEFDELGAPKPRTEAARLGADLEHLHAGGGNINAAVEAATNKAKQAEEELARFRHQRARDLLVALLPAAKQARDEFMEWAAQGEAKYRQLVHVANEGHQLAVAGRRYDRPYASPTFDHQKAGLRMVNDAPAWPLPVDFMNEVLAEQADG